MTTHRCFPRGQRIRSICQPAQEQHVAPEHFPLVEIVRDRLLPGQWLYLHTSAAGTEEPPIFVADGENVNLKASMLLGSWYARRTPISGPEPEKVATVYTAADHLNR